MLLLIRICTCICGIGILLYAYIHQQNKLIEIRLRLPQLAKELKSTQEENNRLKYEIERFESPIHLMELSRKPEFGHLKPPFLKDIIVLPEERKEDEKPQQ